MDRIEGCFVTRFLYLPCTLFPVWWLSVIWARVCSYPQLCGTPPLGLFLWSPSHTESLPCGTSPSVCTWCAQMSEIKPFHQNCPYSQISVKQPAEMIACNGYLLYKDIILPVIIILNSCQNGHDMGDIKKTSEFSVHDSCKIVAGP